MRNTYPLLLSGSEKDIKDVLSDIIRLRQTEDLPDFNNLVNVFVSGRSVNRIPSAPNDVLATDSQGDISYDDDYQYTLVMVSGSLLWDRRALDTGW